MHESTWGAFLERYNTPSFGHLPKREVDLLVFELMMKSGLFGETPTINTIMTRLRISRAKARSLLYDHDLRVMSAKDVDAKVVEALRRPLIMRDGGLFAIEIEHPYAYERAKEVLRRHQYPSDGSFGAGMLRLTPEALATLLEHYADDAEQVKSVLVSCGARPDLSLQAILGGVLRRLGQRVAENAGEEVAGRISVWASGVLDGGRKRLADLWKAGQIASDGA